MLRRGYSPELATGTIAASGTLGQNHSSLGSPLFFLGSVLNVSVGKLFAAALLPGFLLVICYIAYVYIYAQIKPEHAPAMPEEEIEAFKGEGFGNRLLGAFVLPFLLIVAVLGSILAGIASPTEAAAVWARWEQPC